MARFGGKHRRFNDLRFDRFVAACVFGLSVVTAAIAVLSACAPLILLLRKDWREKVRGDWTRATANLNGANAEKLCGFVYYAFFLVLFILFFNRAMFETNVGIFTGGSQNLGDLPFHLGAIFSFTDGNNFPPQNPSFAGATFSYPFVADLLTALLMKFGVDVQSAMLVQNVSWAFALLVILEKFTCKLTGNKLAGKIAPALLFFSGGLGFISFFKDFAAQNKGFFDFLCELPNNYTIREKTFRWGNSLNVLFITQRSLSLGMPLALVVLNCLWEVFSGDAEIGRKGDEETRRKGDEETGRKQSDSSNPEISSSPHLLIFFSPRLLISPSFLIGLLAGTLPLVHLHSLLVLFVVTAFLFVLKPEKWREWISFGIGVAIIAVPELIWSMQGSASHAEEFFGWHFGWDKADDENFLLFWFKNTGVFVPLLLAGILLKFKIQDSRFKIRDSRFKIQDSKSEIRNSESEILNPAILFYLPFVFCFVIANIYKFAPWQWDNIKILIYWFTGSLPLAAFALAWAWRKNVWLKFIAAGLFFILTAAGALDVWRVVSNQINYNVFDADAVKIAAQIKQKTAPDALFLNAPTYNTATVLSGRRSLMRYVGHLSSHGIDYQARLEDVKKMYQGDATAALLMSKYGIEYVLISPKESEELAPNEAFFSRFPVVAESGQYRVYKINN